MRNTFLSIDRRGDDIKFYKHNFHFKDFQYNNTINFYSIREKFWSLFFILIIQKKNFQI